MKQFLIPAAVVLLLGSLGFFAFQGGIGNSATGNVVVEGAAFQSYFGLEETTFDLKDQNVSIINSVVEGSVSGLDVYTQAPAWLTGFTGTITIEDRTVSITGKTLAYAAERITLKNDAGIPVSVHFTKGTFEINNFVLTKFETRATGFIKFNDKVQLNLENTNIIINDYVGFIRNDLTENNMVSLTGTAGRLEIQEKNFLQTLT